MAVITDYFSSGEEMMATKDLDSKTVTELKTIAKKAGISIKSSWKKADIVKALAGAKSSGSAKKSVSKKKQSATKKTASKKTQVRKASKKSTRKVKKAARKAVKKAAPKTAVKKTAKKTLKKIQKKTSPKSTAKKKMMKKTTKKTVSVKSKTVTAKKAPAKKKQVVKSGPAAPIAPTRKTGAKRKSPTAKGKLIKTSRGTIPSTAVRSERHVAEVTKMSVARATRVSLMVVDPYKLFAFWEVSEKDLDNIVKDGEGFSFLLRVYFFREGEQTGFFDVKIAEPYGKKYIEVIPERGYQVELLLVKSSATYSLSLSPVKYTPAYRIDREFSSPEESEIYESQIPRKGGRISS